MIGIRVFNAVRHALFEVMFGVIGRPTDRSGRFGRRAVTLCLVAGWIVTSPPAGAGQLKLTASDGGTGDTFGFSVAMAGDTALVGAPNDDTPFGNGTGSVYVFTRSNGTWTQEARIIAPDGSPSDGFGWSVAVSGESALIGAPGDDDAGWNAGSVYVFTRSNGIWSRQAKLLASDLSQDDAFGRSVALSGDVAVIGAPANPWGAGSAYAFARSNGIWTQQAALVAGDTQFRDSFGASVGISGATALVGSPGNDTPAGYSAGAAYIFDRANGSWPLTAKLIASDGQTNANFGSAVALRGTTALIGAPNHDTSTHSGAGSAYLFTLSGGFWTQQARFGAADAGHSDSFGRSVAVSGGTVLVGAPFHHPVAGVETGAAYVFMGSGTQWVPWGKILASDGASGDRFAVSVALSENGFTRLVGADHDDTAAGSNAGSMHAFTMTPMTLEGSWRNPRNGMTGSILYAAPIDPPAAEKVPTFVLGDAGNVVRVRLTCSEFVPHPPRMARGAAIAGGTLYGSGPGSDGLWYVLKAVDGGPGGTDGFGMAAFDGRDAPDPRSPSCSARDLVPAAIQGELTSANDTDEIG